MIGQMKDDYPTTVLCEVLDCPRSSYYYEAVHRDDSVLVGEIEQIVIRRPYYGYRKVTAQLRRANWQVNSKVVRRIMKQLGLQGRVGQVKICTTDSSHSLPRYPNLIRNLTAAFPDHIWVADITYIQLGKGFIYLAVVLDIFTRAVRGWHLGRSLSRILAVKALEKALLQGVPQLHHSDQGVQYASNDYVQLLKDHQVQISMSEPGQPTQNAFAERFMRTFKEEHFDYTEYTDFVDAYQQIEDWIEVDYMTERLHESLGYVPPAEFEAAYHAQHALSAESLLM
jgi:putative transposase